MTLQEYLERDPADAHGADFIESDRLDICPLALVSGRLGVIDPTTFDGETVEVSPGTYQVQARVMDWADDRRVSRLRVTSCQDVRLGGQVGSVGVDSAQVGVVDWDAAQRASEGLDAEGEQEVISGLDAPTLGGVACWSRAEGVFMPWVSSGFGDGNFPIYELLTGDIRVGAEVVFIHHDGAQA